MSTHEIPQRFDAWRSRMQVWWITILAFAIVIAYADGFWVTSLQGRGRCDRSQRGPIPPLGARLDADASAVLPCGADRGSNGAACGRTPSGVRRTEPQRY